MALEQLHALIAIAERQHVTRAAAALTMAQSARGAVTPKRLTGWPGG